MKKLSHLDETGKARMVDVGAKPLTSREALSAGRVMMQPETLALIKKNQIEKGDVLSTARIAGIMAAKRCPGYLTHPFKILTNSSA